MCHNIITRYYCPQCGQRTGDKQLRKRICPTSQFCCTRYERKLPEHERTEQNTTVCARCREDNSAHRDRGRVGKDARAVAAAVAAGGDNVGATRRKGKGKGEGKGEGNGNVNGNAHRQPAPRADEKKRSDQRRENGQEKKKDAEKGKRGQDHQHQHQRQDGHGHGHRSDDSAAAGLRRIVNELDRLRPGCEWNIVGRQQRPTVRRRSSDQERERERARERDERESVNVNVSEHENEHEHMSANVNVNVDVDAMVATMAIRKIVRTVITDSIEERIEPFDIERRLGG